MKYYDAQKLQTMLDMQAELDNATYTEHKTEFKYELAKLALIDEIGELTHELKADWCWWKKSQKPVDREKVLEELVDVWHFALSICNNVDGVKYVDDWFIEHSLLRNESESIQALVSTYAHTVPDSIALSIKLGFTFDEVYEGYLKKNKVNYERLESGY